VVSIEIYPLECGKLNIRSSILTFAPKIGAFRIFGSGNVMVLSVIKFGFATKNISSSSSFVDSFH
jgi:hypothetical protein